MKVKLFDKILLALLLIIALGISLLLVALAIRFFPLVNLQDILALLYEGVPNALILGGSGLALLAITLKLMFSGEKKHQEPTSTLVHTGELGAAFITLSAIDAMIQKHCRANSKIRDVVSMVRASRDSGVTISVRLSLLPETEIPLLTQELQLSLKEYIEKHAGINVREIGILIENASSTPTGRVD